MDDIDLRNQPRQLAGDQPVVQNAHAAGAENLIRQPQFAPGKGLAVNVSTGLALFISEAAQKGTTVIFWIKLAVIAAALIVATLIKRRVFRSTSSTATISEASHGLRALAALSCVLWTGATGTQQPFSSMEDLWSLLRRPPFGSTSPRSGSKPA